MEFTIQTLVFGVGFLVIGLGAGYAIRNFLATHRKNSIELEIKKLHLDAKAKAQELILEAKNKATSVAEEALKEVKEKERELQKTLDRMTHREEQLEKKSSDLDAEKEKLNQNIDKVKAYEEKVKAREQEHVQALEKIAGLSTEDARKQLIDTVERDAEQVLAERMRKLELQGEERLERKAKDILAVIIQRLASPTTSEVTTTTVAIPSDDVKGKIIGKEGRNIRALERAAGVEIVVDETPGSIMISSFDPVRRQIAKLALEDLIVDGRIHPARIEETVEKAKGKIEKAMKDAADAAAYELGIFDIDPRLMQLLGRLKFRYSYGQNVLQHSLEMAHLAGMLAGELGADVMVAKKGALLHDIGKAVDHEVQGTHVEIGRRILQKFNVDHAIIQAMQSHHEEYPYETLESIIVQTVDAISGGRPGARRDSLENYIKRLEDLEGIAKRFDGVEKCYAIQAGRELRVFVHPEAVTDVAARQLARNIASDIEKELKYPGEIKVMVIRENRVIEFAK